MRNKFRFETVLNSKLVSGIGLTPTTLQEVVIKLSFLFQARLFAVFQVSLSCIFRQSEDNYSYLTISYRLEPKVTTSADYQPKYILFRQNYLSVIKSTIWVPTRSDANRAVQSQKMVRGWQFWI